MGFSRATSQTDIEKSSFQEKKSPRAKGIEYGCHIMCLLNEKYPSNILERNYCIGNANFLIAKYQKQDGLHPANPQSLKPLAYNRMKENLERMANSKQRVPVRGTWPKR